VCVCVLAASCATASGVSIPEFAVRRLPLLTVTAEVKPN